MDIHFNKQVTTIVNLNGQHFREETCACYWPQRRNGEAKWQHFFVTLEEVFEEDHMTVRTLKLLNGAKPNEEPREIRQFQFESWKMYERVRCLCAMGWGRKRG